MRVKRESKKAKFSGKVVIALPKEKHISLEEKFKKYKGDNLSKEYDWGKFVGREIIDYEK